MTRPCEDEETTCDGRKIDPATKEKKKKKKKLKCSWYLTSCCGLCNLFPGVVLTATLQLIFAVALMLLVLNNSGAYDGLHVGGVSLLTGALMSCVLGAALLLLYAVLMDNGRVMTVYLYVAAILFSTLLLVSVFQMSACFKFKIAHVKRQKEDAQKLNLACSLSLVSLLVSFVYLYGVLVVYSFYHFRFVRRALIRNVVANDNCEC